MDRKELFKKIKGEKNWESNEFYQYTSNGCLVMSEGHWIILTTKAMDELNEIMLKYANDSTKHRKVVDGKYVE